MAYTAKTEDLQATARELFDVVAAGHVAISIDQTYPLSETPQAHPALEGRRITGSTLLLP